MSMVKAVTHMIKKTDLWYLDHCRRFSSVVLSLPDITQRRIEFGPQFFSGVSIQPIFWICLRG